MAPIMSVYGFLRMPRKMEWENEIERGAWNGPDGSSSSTDHMMGVRIGVSSPEFKYSKLPANLHDWRYHLGRIHAFPSRYRKAADIEYRQGCVRVISGTLDGKIMILLGTVRAWVRYYALRLFGGSAWTA